MAKFKAPNINKANIIPVILFWLVIGFIAIDGGRHLMPFIYHTFPLMIVALLLFLFIKFNGKKEKAEK